MPHRALVFDFDGTLADSIEATRVASSQVLIEEGFSEISTEETIAGMRLETNARFAFHAGGETNAAARMGARFYDVMLDRVDRIVMVPGIAAVLRGLASRGVPLAVYSNNRGATIRRFLDQKGLSNLFQLVLGDGDGVPLKPSPDGLRQIADRLNTIPGELAYIGDGESDAIASEAAGCFTIGVDWVIQKYGFPISERFPRVVSDINGLETLIAVFLDTRREDGGQ